MSAKVWLLASAAVLAAGAAGWFVASDSSDTAPATRAEALPQPVLGDDIDDDALRRIAMAVDSLSGLLEQEINERRAQADDIAALREQLEALEDNLGERVAQSFGDDGTITVSITSDSPRPPREIPQANLSSAERLAAAGFTDDQIVAFRDVQTQARLDRIALDDRARREGWANTPRYFEELNAASSNPVQTVRESLSDAEFDRYLYAIGQPNRIVVGSVIETSAADQAGFQRGDIVMSYDGQRIWNGQELTELRSAGESGAPTSVEVMRDGVPMTLTIPRGPMGITTVPQAVDPSQ